MLGQKIRDGLLSLYDHSPAPFAQRHLQFDAKGLQRLRRSWEAGTFLPACRQDCARPQACGGPGKDLPAPGPALIARSKEEQFHPPPGGLDHMYTGGKNPGIIKHQHVTRP
ncbi:MAG: hypothetical protein Kow00129_01600 [Thermoleophilia bacterium]